MKNLGLFTRLFLLVTAVCFFSCKETGPEGPQGLPGADGSIILSGTGAPTANMGKSGDYYLNISTAELYGPKSDQGWEAPISLQGERGKEGSQILSGSSEPSSSIGKEGDYYLDISNHTLFGPKTSLGWGTGIVLLGGKGPKGDKGDQGNANVISSGWMTIPSEDWRNLPSVGQFNPNTINFTESGELDWLVNYPKGYHIDAANTTGVILMYVDNGGYYGIKLAPFELPVRSIVSGRGVVGSIKYRFSIQNTSSGYDLYPVVALKSGEWNRDGFIKNTFLPDIKWRIVMIPANANARYATSPPDPQDYKATCEYYGIAE